MPIVPMTAKPEDSLYPEPEEQKIEINPLSYLNTPDTATEAEFAVAVDELAKLSPCLLYTSQKHKIYISIPTGTIKSWTMK